MGRDLVDLRSGVGDSVAVVVDRVDARVDLESLFDENIQSPQGPLGHREAWGTIGGNPLAHKRFENLPRLPQVVAKFRGALVVDEMVRVAVGADFVSRLIDIPN